MAEKGEGMEEIDRVKKLIGEINPVRYLDKEKKPNPVWQNKLVYDSTSETLEPVYFWILDFTQNQAKEVIKLVDNFTASPGSGYFAELGMRATRMQEEGMKILGAVNTVIKSILNLIYDLKEFEIRLKHYESARSQNPQEKEAAILALKQIWMDNVDIKRGRGSINMLTYELSFTTLRDAFMVARTIEDVDKLDLNDRVKRILKPRVAEFIEWWKRSETELKKRFEVEKTYLKSQISALKLYSRWAKPYFKAAEQLRMKDIRSPDVINIFNTILMELTLFAKNPIDVADAAYNKRIPLKFATYKPTRKYYSCVFIDFKFRGIPRRISPQEAHYVFGGRSDIQFLAYALNDDEIAYLNQELEKNDIEDALKMVDITTTETLEQIKADIEYFLKDEQKKPEAPKAEAMNPFSALFSLKKSATLAGKKPSILNPKLIRRDNHKESVIRSLAEQEASEFAFRIFDVYKKAHDMASIPGGMDFEEFFKVKWKPGF
ncbi:hypothetical protein HZA33_04035 [Candidatus Pacearchaeota archaeon]|nr:hypothetical protein [Candidatus Pacearchaeota archaeon]